MNHITYRVPDPAELGLSTKGRVGRRSEDTLWHRSYPVICPASDATTAADPRWYWTTSASLIYAASRDAALIAYATARGHAHLVYVPTWAELDVPEPDGDGQRDCGTVSIDHLLDDDTWWIGTAATGEMWFSTPDEVEARWYVAVLKALEAGL